MKIRVSVVAPLLFGSGLCALVYQTAWLREFRLIFGATTPASAAVLAIFMGGLGWGSAVLGRRSETKERPLGFYGQLELLIAVAAALTPALVWLVREVYLASGGTQAWGLVPATLLRLVLSALVLAVPTFLMGGTLPAAARAVEASDDPSRRRLAFLYGANTLGAVTGAALATFFLFERFGNRFTIWLACALNAAVALIAIWLSRKAASVPIESPAPAPVVQSSAMPAVDGAPVASSFVLTAAALVGFAFLLMEIVWYRMLTPLLGGTTFTFGLILAVALLGIGLGGIAYAWRGSDRPPTVRGFALSCALEAVCVAVPLALGDRIAVAATLLRSLGLSEFFGHVAAWTMIASFVILPAAVVAGFQFPLLIGLLGRGREQVGRHTGQAYAANTLGAIAGSMAGGFGFLPLLSAPGTWRLVIALLAVLGLGALFFSSRQERGGGRFGVLLAAGAAVAMLFATGPTAAWRHSGIGAGRVDLDYLETPNLTREWIHYLNRGMLWQTDGREVALGVDKTGSLIFVVNGKSDGSARGDAGTQVMAGLVGALFHAKPERVFVVGLGSGSTAGWLAALPTVQRLDVAELEPAIVKFAAQCSSVNHGVLTNSRAHVIIGDGREVLQTSRGNYDLVVSEPSNLFRAGVAGLYTQDFYRTVARKLNRGGIFLQWVQAYETDATTLETVFATLHSVFPHLEAWQSRDTDLVFVASLEPVSYDVPVLRQRIQEEPFKSALLNTWRVTDLEGVFGHYLGNAEFSRRVAETGGAVLNTDDRTVLEYAFARSMGGARGGHLDHLRETAVDLGLHRPACTNGPVDWAAVLQRRSAFHILEGHKTEEPRLGTNAIARARAQRFYMAEDMGSALFYWRAQNLGPRDLVETTMVAELYAEDGDTNALPLIERLRTHQPIEADAILARYHFFNNDPTNAALALRAAFLAYRNNPWPQPNVMRRALKLATAIADEGDEPARLILDVLTQPFSTYCLESARERARCRVARAVNNKKPGLETLQAVEAYEPYPWWDIEFLEVRAECYRKFNHAKAAEAERDVRTYRKYDPPSFRLRSETKD